jgi:hypothetical protein
MDDTKYVGKELYFDLLVANATLNLLKEAGVTKWKGYRGALEDGLWSLDDLEEQIYMRVYVDYDEEEGY